MTERPRVDCADAPPLRGFGAHRPRGSLVLQKEDCPRPGEKPGRGAGPEFLVPPGRGRVSARARQCTVGRDGCRGGVRTRVGEIRRCERTVWPMGGPGERPRSFARARAREGGPDAGGSGSLVHRSAPVRQLSRAGGFRAVWEVFGTFFDRASARTLPGAGEGVGRSSRGRRGPAVLPICFRSRPKNQVQEC